MLNDVFFDLAALCVDEDYASPRPGAGVFVPAESTEAFIQYIKSIRENLDGHHFKPAWGLHVYITGANTPRVEIKFCKCLGPVEEDLNYPHGFISILLQLDEEG